MGIFRKFSCSVYDGNKVAGSTYANKGPYIPPNPDPSNWEILRYEYIGNVLVIEIKYPDCTNYEGRKILMYNNVSLVDIVNQKVIDPHFCDNKRYKHPIARFEPTEEGWVLAIKTAGIL